MSFQAESEASKRAVELSLSRSKGVEAGLRGQLASLTSSRDGLAAKLKEAEENLDQAATAAASKDATVKQCAVL